ncbi:TlpA family protein disulfide reductase [Rubrivivax sp. A210]|uniref:TlpA family protein disulfide reductase n=1 Tax=Rubrivivax sp. A210 TaxID=2772301 RepID=UPI001F29F58E|nr:TlpA disulfide reductase family protein [Rubrivivax sp. A210]
MNDRQEATSTGRRSLLMAAAALALPAAARAKTPGEVEIGQTLREAQLDGLNGKPRPLTSFRGKPLIINVWASWCGPCRAEMASLERLAWSGQAGQAQLIGISTDDYRDKALAWLKASNATISHYIDHRLELENMLGASQLPLTILVDARGRVLAKVYGAQEWDSPAAVQMITRSFGGQGDGKGGSKTSSKTSDKGTPAR